MGLYKKKIIWDIQVIIQDIEGKMLKTTYKSLQHNCVFEILVVEISKFNCNCNQFIRFLFAYLGKISVKGIAQNLLVRPGKNKYPINGLLPLSNKFLASKLTKFQFQIFIHLIPVTIYIYFKFSKYLWVMFQNLDFSANLLSYTCIYDLQKMSEEFSFLC